MIAVTNRNLGSLNLVKFALVAVVATILTATGSTQASEAAGIPHKACKNMRSVSCVYDGRHMGDDHGRSFWVNKGGKRHFITHKRAHRMIARMQPRVAPKTTPAPKSPTTAPASKPRTLPELVDQAIADFQRLDDDKRGVHQYSWMAQAVAIRRGWNDPLVATYLDKVFRQQHADGGYGLPFAWDAFGDGTTNPTSTSYAITLSDHVGPALLAGWQAGVVDEGRVQQIIDLVEAFPASTLDDRCVSYSNSPGDLGYCVGNINASAAYFLTTAAAAGFDVDVSRVPGLIAYDKSTLIDGEWWPYRAGRPGRQDWQHNATMVQAFMTLDPEVGRRALDAMRRATAPNPYERASLLRLAEFDCTLADAALLAPALQQHSSSADMLGILAYEGAKALEACPS